jgi:hypothetical protein
MAVGWAFLLSHGGVNLSFTNQPPLKKKKEPNGQDLIASFFLFSYEAINGSCPTV